MSENDNEEKVSNLLVEYIKWYNITKKYGIRAPNFPEYISENIIKCFIINHEKVKCINAMTGDLSKILHNGIKKKNRSQMFCQ